MNLRHFVLLVREYQLPNSTYFQARFFRNPKIRALGRSSRSLIHDRRQPLQYRIPTPPPKFEAKLFYLHHLIRGLLHANLYQLLNQHQ